MPLIVYRTAAVTSLSDSVNYITILFSECHSKDSKSFGNTPFTPNEMCTIGCPKKFDLILRLNFGVVHFSMKKMLLLDDSRGMYKSFDT